MSASAALSKQYDPSEVEPRWLRFWLENGYFHADENSPTVPYAITLPPPNVTGSLHMGHALGSTMQDILIRWRRMQGYNAMWMPGTDHASIAVHHLLEKALRRKESKTRFDLGRDEFMRRAWEWRDKSGGRITEQEKLMGFSLDWPRDRFTMDDQSNAAVREAFVKLYEEGLIYRANRMINWDPVSETVVSDLEIDVVEEAGSMWELNYPLVDGNGAVITVATTRPETMLGDTAVAVHPDDERYQHLVGKMIALPLTGRHIPIVADTFVDPTFGSGAVKVTPAHDPNDYECAQRCNLPALQIIDAKGRMCGPIPEKYIGMLVEAARREVVADLELAGALGLIKDHKVPRGRSERSGAVVEPMLMEQWFVRTAPLAAKAVEAVESGKTKFVPEVWTKTYMHWMTNIRDWCISRQLWWGHRIPAWYCNACKHITVARATVTACEKCASADVRQDEDILDTWFSSALWPFSTLGWPNKTRELAAFYPNSVLVTGPDIIFFWVARMMMMGIHFMGKAPFRTVYLTSIVTDENGDKMSKTKGNVLDPLNVVHGASLEEMLTRATADNADDAALKALRRNFAKGVPSMGADALRFALAALNTSGRYIRLSAERVEGYRNFINKLWNASRFALMNLDGFDPERFEAQLADRAPASAGSLHAGPNKMAMGLPERWILSRLQAVSADVDTALEGFRFADAANALYHFVWNEVCDWYIELAKPHLRQAENPGSVVGEPDAARAAKRHVVQGVLATVLERVMRLMHPFAPFVTEEIWQKLPKPVELPGSLMVTVYPRPDLGRIDAAAEAEMKLIQDVAVASRMLRATYGISPAQNIEVELRIAAGADAARRTVTENLAMIERSARIKATIGQGSDVVPQSAKALVGADIEIIMPLGGLIDPAAEKARITKEIGRVEKDIAGLEKKLSNADFLARAPEEVVVEQKARLTDEHALRTRLQEAMTILQAGI
ncbi:MAG: valine--tRNA ligase [Kofleriaceae bacterium]|nr:valine--tRNA ligase [Kofleriaceae bacterium]